MDSTPAVEVKDVARPTRVAADAAEAKVLFKAHHKRMEARQKLRRAADTAAMIEAANIPEQRFVRAISLPVGPAVDWDAVPACLAPRFDNNVGDVRGLRKRQQCESFLRVVGPVLSELSRKLGRRLKVVDLGSGTGNASLPLAWIL